MALLPILTAPDPRLKKQCAPVESVDGTIRQLIDDMLETMYNAPGVGLAAPQVDVLKRVIVVDVSKDEEERAPHCLVNPELTWVSDHDNNYEEGCLSLPDYYGEVARPSHERAETQHDPAQAPESKEIRQAARQLRDRVKAAGNGSAPHRLHGNPGLRGDPAKGLGGA
jgi:peptide deformylase